MSDKSNWLGRRVAALEDMSEDEAHPLYPTRDARSKLWKQLLGPYIDGLKASHRDVLEATFFERLTHAEYAARKGLDRTTVTRNVERAMSALVLAIANDDPAFAVRPKKPGRPRREPELEKEAAWRVLQGKLGEVLRG